MIKAEFEMDMPRECHECPFQLKFKGEDVNDWYTRRCVLINQRIEYPRPDWCPLQPVKEDEPRKGKWIDNGNGTISCSECGTWFPKERVPFLYLCGCCGAKMERQP